MGLAILAWHRKINRSSVPLEIHYPAGDKNIASYISYFFEQQKSDASVIKIVELTAGQIINFEPNGRVRVEAFPVIHETGLVSLGYSVIEKKKKLKPEFASIPQNRIKAAINEKGEAAYDFFESKLLTVCGDCSIAPVDQMRGSEIAIIDSTYLEPPGRDEKTHLTVAEAVAAGNAAGVKKLVLSHFSTMYSEDEITKKVAKDGGNTPIGIVLPGKILEI